MSRQGRPTIAHGFNRFQPWAVCPRTKGAPAGAKEPAAPEANPDQRVWFPRASGAAKLENIFTLLFCLAAANGLKISPCAPVFCSAPLEAARRSVASRKLARN